LIGTLLQNLFQDEVRDQRPFVLGWLKIAIESLRARIRRPGQVLAIAGPRDCGKSLVQNLITEIFGGRAAKPYRYMSGATPFNGDLFGAEHLMIEDECGSFDLRSRREFGARIKDFTVNEVQSCHAKNKQAISLRPFWRLSISLNAEPENLLVLPPIDESLMDKIILLRGHWHEMPMPTQGLEERSRFWRALMDELPAFIDYLLQWEIPQHIRSPRFGVASWQHPNLLDAIDALSPEVRLLGLIDAVLFGAGDKPPETQILTANELERRLMSSPMAYEARRLLTWDTACGTYLGHLAAKAPHRVEADRTAKKRGWLISPPHLASNPMTP
jgi:hypothetical protein